MEIDKALITKLKNMTSSPTNGLKPWDFDVKQAIIHIKNFTECQFDESKRHKEITHNIFNTGLKLKSNGDDIYGLYEYVDAKNEIFRDFLTKNEIEEKVNAKEIYVPFPGSYPLSPKTKFEKGLPKNGLKSLEMKIRKYNDKTMLIGLKNRENTLKRNRGKDAQKDNNGENAQKGNNDSNRDFRDFWFHIIVDGLDNYQPIRELIQKKIKDAIDCSWEKYKKGEMKIAYHYRDAPNYFLPLYLSNNNVPTCVLVFHVDKGVCKPVTTLNMDEAWQDMQLLNDIDTDFCDWFPDKYKSNTSSK